MSVELMGAVFYLALPPGPKLLLLSLADNANESGHAWPSQQTLALKVSATVRSVRSQTRMLEADDWLSLTESAGRGHNIHYYLNAERIKAEAAKQKAEVDAIKAEKAEVGAEKRKLATGKAEVGVDSNRQEPSLEPSGPGPTTIPQKKEKPKWEPPEWWAPLVPLKGYRDGNHSRAAEVVAASCVEAGVPEGEVVSGFAEYYRLNRVRHGWSDPVKALKATLALQIKKTLEADSGTSGTGPDDILAAKDRYERKTRTGPYAPTQ